MQLWHAPKSTPLLNSMALASHATEHAPWPLAIPGCPTQLGRKGPGMGMTGGVLGARGSGTGQSKHSRGNTGKKALFVVGVAIPVYLNDWGCRYGLICCPSKVVAVIALLLCYSRQAGVSHRNGWLRLWPALLHNSWGLARVYIEKAALIKATTSR